MKIAHFSDVHALSLEGVRPWQFLNKRVAGYINLRLNRKDKHPVALFQALVEDLNRRQVDQIIVTGDLTNLSLDAEFRLARRLLDELRLGPEAVTAIPGNHDVYTLGARREGLFRQRLLPYALSDEGDGVRFPLVRERGEVVIIGLDTAMPSPPPFADGWVGRAQLAALAELLPRYANKFRILALHHPPYDNRHALLRGLRDRGALCQLLASHGVELILHGHEHRDLRREIAGPTGPIPVIGVGSGTYADPRPERRARYNVYTIEAGRLVAVDTYAHDGARGRFVPPAELTPPAAVGAA